MTLALNYYTKKYIINRVLDSDIFYNFCVYPDLSVLLGQIASSYTDLSTRIVAAYELTFSRKEGTEIRHVRASKLPVIWRMI